MSDLSQLDSEDLAQLNTGLQRALSYTEQVRELKAKYPGVIVVEGIPALGDFLRYHTWNRQDMLTCFPWGEKLFRAVTGSNLPFILNNEQVREAYPEIFNSWDNMHKNAVKLYSPEDMLEWFRVNLVSTIETVLVPLTLFTDHPDKMRDVFERLKEQRLNAAKSAISRVQLRKIRLSTWAEIISLVRKDMRDQIGKYFDDAKAVSEATGVSTTRARFPKYEVKLPADKMPIFCEKQGIGKTRHYDSPDVSYSTVNFFGWAEHAVREECTQGKNLRRRGFTQGLWFGGKKCIKDYESGLVELMTAERFVNIFGLEVLQKADWRFSSDLCRWAKPGAKFGPGLPPAEQSLLLGINHVAPKEK